MLSEKVFPWFMVVLIEGIGLYRGVLLQRERSGHQVFTLAALVMLPCSSSGYWQGVEAAFIAFSS
jgi:hypothetical protein